MSSLGRFAGPVPFAVDATGQEGLGFRAKGKLKTEIPVDFGLAKLVRQRQHAGEGGGVSAPRPVSSPDRHGRAVARRDLHAANTHRIVTAFVLKSRRTLEIGFCSAPKLPEAQEGQTAMHAVAPTGETWRQHARF